MVVLVLLELLEMLLFYENYVLFLDNEEIWENVLILDDLIMLQKGKVRDLLKEFFDVFLGKLNLIYVIIYRIDIGEVLFIYFFFYKVL